MTSADKIQLLATGHTPTQSDALDTIRLRPFRIGYAALLKPRRVGC